MLRRRRPLWNKEKAHIIPWVPDAQTEDAHMEARVSRRGSGLTVSLHTTWRALGFCGPWIWEFEPNSSISQGYGGHSCYPGCILDT